MITAIDRLIAKRKAARERLKKAILKAGDKARKKGLENDDVWNDYLDEVFALATLGLGIDAEIQGIRIADRVAKEHPGSPGQAIEDEIDAELKEAAELGERAQKLREQAFRDAVLNPKKSKEESDEASALSLKHDQELARLRGKSDALGVYRTMRRRRG